MPARWILSSLALAGALAGALGCSFDAGADGARLGGDAGPAGGDADPIACTPQCLDDERLSPCDGAEPVECALGCDTEANACHAIVPANGAGLEHLDGVTASISIPVDGRASLDTDSGLIRIDDQVVRPEGPGVVGGLGFYVLPGGPALLAVDRLTIAVDARLRVTGTRPLIVLSRGDVVIAGLLDVSGGCDGGAAHCGGPGGGDGAVHGDEPQSATGCSPGGNGSGGIGPFNQETGGGGGAFGAAGGNGGSTQEHEGDDDDANGGPGGSYPGECAGESLEPLMGGSGGGAGGLSVGAATGAQGGGGGGAVQISSMTGIGIIATADGDTPGIRASGAGGSGGGLSDGGGGGGSGGGVLLEAPIISINGGVIAANGGGGGGGGGGVFTDAQRGQDGPFSAERARGGGDGSGRGGWGGSLMGLAGDGRSGRDDTGGGGGAFGRIRLNSADADVWVEDSILSPSPSIHFVRTTR